MPTKTGEFDYTVISWAEWEIGTEDRRTEVLEVQRLPEVTRRYWRLPEDSYRRPGDQDGRSRRRNPDGQRIWKNTITTEG